MSRQTLSELVQRQIQELCAKGDALVEERQYEQAFYSYRDALNLLPEPVEEWEATTWILSAIGDLYFLERKVEKALCAFEDAVRCPTGLGNAFIHLRLGQCYFDLGELDRAADELARAYMAAGREIFENEDPKYTQLLESRIVPPLDQNSL